MSKRALTPHLVLAGPVQLNEEATPAADDRPVLLRCREMRRTRPAGTSDFGGCPTPASNTLAFDTTYPDGTTPKNSIALQLSAFNLAEACLDCKSDLLLPGSSLSDSHSTRRPCPDKGVEAAATRHARPNQHLATADFSLEPPQKYPDSTPGSRNPLRGSSVEPIMPRR